MRLLKSLLPRFRGHAWAVTEPFEKPQRYPRPECGAGVGQLHPVGAIAYEPMPRGWSLVRLSPPESSCTPPSRSVGDIGSLEGPVPMSATSIAGCGPGGYFDRVAGTHSSGATRRTRHAGQSPRVEGRAGSDLTPVEALRIAAPRSSRACLRSSN